GPEAGAIAGLFAFLGHLFPVWLGFKGGKGVATYIGTLLGVAPLFVLVFAAVWLTMAFVFRYSSLAALTAMLVIPVA
ncbi:glycerol-3-phosphate acyltransferase, partial [Chryseobacterium sp. SIMBA_028]